MYSKKEKTIKLSTLSKTWILDLDGTIVKHNGYKIDGKDTLLDGAKQFLEQIPKMDKVVFFTSRSKEIAELTESFLESQEIRYDVIIYDVPYGERILINDRKPSGLRTAIAINTIRDEFMNIEFEVDPTL